MNDHPRQNNFNLVRLTLALVVIFGHSPELIDGNRGREWLTRLFGTLSFGELAVDGFFLLSGYLITQSWNTHPHAWQFLKKRLLRIYPGFLVASLVCAFIVGPFSAPPAIYFGAFDLSAFLRGLVFLKIPVAPEVFANTPYASLNGSMWTISKEFKCYLLILAAGVAGILRLRHVCLACTMIVLAAFAWFKLNNVPTTDLRLASFFLSGSCYYMYSDYIRYKGSAAAIAAAIVVVFMFSSRASELCLATVGGYALLYVGGKRSALLSQFNRLPDVSYGAYLYGWPIQKLLLWYCPSLSPLALFAFAAPAALLMGTVSWYLVEKPALRFKGPTISIPDEQHPNLAS